MNIEISVNELQTSASMDTPIIHHLPATESNIYYSILQYPVKGAISHLNQQTGAFRYHAGPGACKGEESLPSCTTTFLFRAIDRQTALYEDGLAIIKINRAPITKEQPTSTIIVRSVDDLIQSRGSLKTRDPDGDELIFNVIKQPEHGQVIMSGGDFTFSAPEIKSDTSVTFLLSASDGKITSMIPVQVDILFAPLPASAAELTTEGDIISDFQLLCNQSVHNNSPMIGRYSVTSHPTSGSLTLYDAENGKFGYINTDNSVDIVNVGYQCSKNNGITVKSNLEIAITHPESYLGQWSKKKWEGYKNISDIAELENHRKEQISVIFGGPAVPDRWPDNTIINYVDDRYSDIQSLASIDLHIVSMDVRKNGIFKTIIDSKIYRFHAKHKNGKLVIYQQGHGGDFVIGKKSISAMLTAGFDVLAISMPRLGMNSLGEMPFDSTSYGHHDLIDKDQPMHFFFEPIFAALNKLASEEDFSEINMVGISGGGDTITKHAAIDNRISKSYSVAGYVIVGQAGKSNYTDTYPKHAENYSKYFNLNKGRVDPVLAASVGDKRKHVMIHNPLEPCCTGAHRGEEYKIHLERTVESIAENGGEFNLIRDYTTTTHQISPSAIAYIIQDMIKD